MTNASSGDNLTENIPFSKGRHGSGRNNEAFFKILIIPSADRLKHPELPPAHRSHVHPAGSILGSPRLASVLRGGLACSVSVLTVPVSLC